VKRAYTTLLRLYPRDYRALFAAEMLTAFEITAGERHAAGRPVYFCFVAAELIGLVKGVVSEWIVKLTTDPSIRGRSLPDRLMMRPPGVPWEVYYAGAFVNENPRCSSDT
jgi:hypothetical protein